ncbi:TagK domain-containing protein [Lelliottia sp. CFBP8978]|jgi:hypothetical protein|uniref:TagK domain-containing protein n=1 Tax=Lelliottia sp. CFBP8978 TaxID=3096522 RepID=UPI002A69E374|nr:TagK domain-containing protein [Lelliottia sp. CFBP8978]MDY1035623.1 TagK domain-containing protein [Lelliottia sp. CFBP8978]
MIYLTLYWPERQQQWALEAKILNRFCAVDGHFMACQKAVMDDDTVTFLLHNGSVEIVSYLVTLPCYVDGKALQYGERCQAEVGTLIQIARYAIVIENELSDETLIQTLGFSADSGKGAPLPELEDILHNSMLHVAPQREEEQNDILKALEKEFRQALIWGVQTPQSQQPIPVRETRFAERMFDFELIQAQVKSATVTQCIFETPSLIHKVFEEHEIRDDDTFFQNDKERYDVLRILAPEEIHYDNKKRLPDLLVQEMYQADLDTQF